MIRRTVIIVCCLSFSSSVAFAQDDVLDKIKLLEQQILELKALKQQQTLTEVKFDHCIKVVAREKFCTCVSANLPREVSFEQYVHTLLTTREKLGYESMTVDQKKSVDATIEVREKCIEKGFFK
jgi:hypothetical protein